MLSREEIAQLADELAPRIAALLTPTTPGTHLDAGEVARLLGVSRDFVYRHRSELGGHAIGAGTKPRLRFDPQIALSAHTAARGGQPTATPVRQRKRRESVSSAPLLPIRGGCE